MGLFQPPGPHPLAPGSETTRKIVGPVVEPRFSDSPGGGQPCASVVRKLVPDLPAPNSSFSAYLKPCLILPQTSMPPAWYWLNLGQVNPQFPRFPIQRTG